MKSVSDNFFNNMFMALSHRFTIDPIYKNIVEIPWLYDKRDPDSDIIENRQNTILFTIQKIERFSND